METISGRSLFTDGRILWRNRAYESEEGVNIDLTLAGFSVTVEGKGVSAEMKSYGDCILLALVDGVPYRRVRLTGEKRRIVFMENLSGKHQIDVLRLTEQKKGDTVVIYGIEAEKFCERPQEKPHFITVYGDSVACGYGTDGLRGEEFLIETENPLHGFVWKLFTEFNADYELFSYSGISVSEKIWVPEFTLGDICFGHSATNRAPWDYPRKSEVVVLHIGTNDSCALRDKVGTAQSMLKGYLVFLHQVQKTHPTAKIVITSGFMDMEPDFPRVADEAYKIMNDEFPGQFLRFVFPRNTFGSNGHPNAEGHEKGGRLLVDFIRKNVEGL